VGNPVLVLNGPSRGRTATLSQINEADFTCDLNIEDERKEKKMLLGVAYEDFSKLYSGD
jgi:hypothetical protein